MKKEVLEKLYGSKIELSEVNVDLALIDDFKKMLTSMSAEAKKAYDDAKKVDDLHKSVNDKNKVIADKLLKQSKEAYVQLRNAEGQAKNLGIELPKEFYDTFQAISDISNKVPVSNLGNVFPI